MRIEVKELSFSYGSRRVLSRVCFSAAAGEVIALLGPNGAGKSTLFRCLLGLGKPDRGAVLLDGSDVRRLSPRVLSHKVACIPQSSASAFPYTVLDSVLMGTTGRLHLLGSPGKAEVEAAEQALGRLGIGHLRDRPSTSISGGERQLMLVARALVQQAGVLLWDEPTASLDFGNSHTVMERAAALGAEGCTVLFSTHQPEAAFRYATRVLALCGGELLADGPPERALTEALLERLYRVPVSIYSADSPAGTQRVVIPHTEKEK